MSAVTVRFGLLCSMFQAMARDRSPAKKRSRLRTFLDRVYTDRADYFSAVRLILPSLDRERGTYGLKESALALCLVEALGISKDSQDALRLVNWRKGGARAGANAGNFALIASEVLQRRQGLTSGGLTIKEVNDALDELATKENRAEKATILSSLIKKTNAVEMKWLLMIILKDLKLGVSEKSIFSEFHPDAEDLFNVTCDLKLVCEKLNDRSQRHKRQDIEVGKAVRPQLAMRVSDAATAWKKLHGKKIVVECKFDGDRIQIHKNGSEINYFSRNFLDHSEYVHGMSDVILQNVLLDRCILDGEMLVWDSSTQRFAEFGSNQEIAKAAREGLASDRQLCYVAFDVLYVGDSSVIHQSLSERHDLLRKVVRPVKGRLEILVPEGGLNDRRAPDDPCWSVFAYNLEDVERFFKQTVENRDEGIIIKDLGSKWEPSDRSGKWLKLKPDYIHPGADLDVLILGGYFGSGRRGGEVAQFLMGLAEPSPLGSHPKRFLSFCRVGTGLSDDELDSLVAKLKPYFRKNEHPKKPPRFYEVTNNSKERPDVWIESPDKSVILTITSDVRTIKSEVFAAPYSLRFPRILRVRYDKPWHECLDLQSFVDLVHASNGSMQGGIDHAVSNNNNNSKRLKISKTGERKIPMVPSHFVKTDISNVREQSYIFTNMMFYFANIPASYSVEYFHKLIAENGGTFSMNLNDSVTHCIAAEKKGIKYQAATRHGDVIHYSWVLDCCAQKCRIHLQPKYYIFITDTSKRKFQEEMDAFSDYYYWDLDDSDIKQIFGNMNGLDDSKTINYYQRKYCLSESRCMFQDCRIFFLKPFNDIDGDFKVISELASRRMKLDVVSCGGEIANRLERATHLIVFSARDWVKDFYEFYKSFPPSHQRVLHSKRLHILNHEWVEDSVAAGRKLSEIGYNLKPESFEASDTESQEVDEIPHSNDMEEPILTVPDQRDEKRRRGRPTTTKARKGSTVQSGRKRARIGSRAAKIDQEESESSGPSRDYINIEDPEKADEFELNLGHSDRATLAAFPKSSKSQKSKIFAKSYRTKRARVGPRRARIDRDASGGSSSDKSNSREGSDKKIQELVHLGASTDPQIKDSSCLHDDPSHEQCDIHDVTSRHLNSIATSSGLKSDSSFDPVQAMLFDMIPSLSQRESEAKQSHEDKSRSTEKQLDKEKQPGENVEPTVAKKKVSYKDVADELLKDWF